MNETITYQVTPEMQKRSVQAYFWKHAIGHRWIAIPVVFLIGAFLNQSRFTEPQNYVGTGLIILGIFYILLYVKSYREHMQMGRDALNLDNSTDVTITLADDTITIAKGNSCNQVQWNRVNRFIETRGSIILFSNTMPVGNLPKTEFSTDQLEFIIRKTKRGPTR